MRQVWTVGVMALVTAVAYADDKADAKAEMKARVAAYIDAAKPGAYYSEEKDTKDGEIIRVFVVGSSVISTTLGVEEGLEIAQERAEESAKAAFVNWLGSKVTIRKNVKNEIVMTKEGEENADGQGTSKEAAKRVERRTKEFEETASSMVKGLKVVGTDQIGKQKKYVVVYRLDVKSLGAIDKIGAKLNAKPGEEAKKPAEKDAPEKKTAPGKEIPSKRIIIDD